MNLYEKVLCSIILGAIITLATYLVSMTGGMLGTQQYGFPFFWLTQMVYPGASPVINWFGLVADISIWTIVVLVIIHSLSVKNAGR